MLTTQIGTTFWCTCWKLGYTKWHYKIEEEGEIAMSVTAVQSPLNLMLTIQPGKNETILNYLQQNQAAINAALTKVGTVHFARFLMIPGTQYLFVITAYDGDFNTYIQAFTNLLGDVFNELLSCVDPAPPLPVQQNINAFEQFVNQYNLPTGLYSAYPNCTVVQIWGNGCTPPQQ